MTTTDSTSNTRAIVVEDFMPHSPERVWEAITQSAYLDRWLMKNDFKPIVGHRFTFQAQPMGDRGVDFQRFGGNASPFAARHVRQRAHVVAAIGQLDENDPYIPSHGKQHFSK